MISRGTFTIRSWNRKPAGRFVLPESTVSKSDLCWEGQCLRHNCLRDWMQGEELCAVRLMMEAKANTFGSSCGSGVAVDALSDLDLDVLAICGRVAFGSSVESTVPTATFPSIKSANCDECGEWME